MLHTPYGSAVIAGMCGKLLLVYAPFLAKPAEIIGYFHSITSS